MTAGLVRASGTAEEASTTAAEPRRRRPGQYIDLRSKTRRTTEVSLCPSWPRRVTHRLRWIRFHDFGSPLVSPQVNDIPNPNTTTCYMT